MIKTSVSSQDLKGITIDKQDTITITFEDGSRDKLYTSTEDGGLEIFHTPTSELKLTPTEYEKLVKLVKRASKKSNAEYKQDKYVISAYSFSEGIVYFSNEENAIGEIFIEDIDKL